MLYTLSQSHICNCCLILDSYRIYAGGGILFDLFLSETIEIYCFSLFFFSFFSLSFNSIAPLDFVFHHIINSCIEQISTFQMCVYVLLLTYLACFVCVQPLNRLTCDRNWYNIRIIWYMFVSFKHWDIRPNRQYPRMRKSSKCPIHSNSRLIKMQTGSILLHTPPFELAYYVFQTMEQKSNFKHSATKQNQQQN